MTAHSLRVIQKIIFPYSPSIPPSHSTSLESTMTASSLRITQRIISPYSSSIPPSQSTSLESIRTAASLRCHTENHISILPLPPTPQSLDQSIVNYDGCSCCQVNLRLIILIFQMYKSYTFDRGMLVLRYLDHINDF